MSHIRDEHLIDVLARAGREFDQARNALLVEDEPTPEEVEKQIRRAAARGWSPPAGPDRMTDHGGWTDAGPGGGPRGAVSSVARTAVGAVGSAAAAAARFGVRRITGAVHPRHPEWSRLSVQERVGWWVDRFGTGVAALAALPSVGGFVTRTALSTVLSSVGAAGQVLVVYAVAHEVGVTDEAARVVAAASIVLDRELDVDAVRRRMAGEGVDGEPGQPEPLATEAGWHPHPEDPPGLLRRLGSAALLTRRVSRQFRSVVDLFDERPQGGLVARTLRNLPGVGMLGGFLAERGGVRETAREALAAFGHS